MENPEDRIRVGEHVTIYRRGKRKTYCADFWRDGKHCRQSLKTSNLKVAHHRAAIIDGELAAGTFQSPLPQTAIAAAIEDFMAFDEAENRAVTTRRRYRNLLNGLQKFLADLGVTKMHQFAASHFDSFRAGRVHHHLATRRCDGVMIKHFFDWCAKRRLNWYLTNNLKVQFQYQYNKREGMPVGVNDGTVNGFGTRVQVNF